MSHESTNRLTNISWIIRTHFHVKLRQPIRTYYFAFNHVGLRIQELSPDDDLTMEVQRRFCALHLLF